MRKLHLLNPTFWVLALIFLFTAPRAEATHAMGVDVTYECLGGNQYQFTLTFYRDCAGTTAPASVTLSMSSVSCGATASVVLTQVGAGVEVSPLCPSQLGNSTCSGGTLPGVQQYTYTGTYTFTQNCPDWVISWSHCCRNNMITNLSSPGSYNMYVETTLNNTLSSCNSSPYFSSLPVPYICVGQLFCYNHGAVDSDGDSLVYSLVQPLSAAGTGVPYVAPYSATYPITSLSGTVSFDSLTGSMCVTPDVPQVAVVTILVEEYRNGVLIGSTMRDLQIVVQNCTNQQPSQASGGITSVTGAVQLDSNSVELCPGDTVSFQITFNDPNPSDIITITNNLASAIPGATINVSGTNPVVVTVTWPTTALDVGLHNFTLTVQDDGCPILGSQVYSYDIRVLAGTYAGPDLYYCPAGGPVGINASGGSTFTWNTLSGDAGGLSCTNCPNPQASPSVTSVYEVVSNLSGTCKNRDTVVVNVVPDFVLDAGNDTSICKYSTAQLNGTANPGAYAPYTWSWSPSSTLSNGSINNPIANNTSTTSYVLTATSSMGCVIRDTVTVTISGVAPIVNITPLDTICENTTTQVDVSVLYECDTTSLPCTGPNTVGTVGNGTSYTTTYSPTYMSTTTPYTHRKQFIYSAAELNAMGFSGGEITSVAFYFSTANDATPGLTVKMGCTSLDEFPASPNTFIPNLTTVKNAYNFQPAIGWTQIALDNPYMWDGVSNLIVEICEDGSVMGTASSVRYTCLSPVYYRCMYYLGASASGGCSYPTGTRTSCRPDMQFTWCEALPPISYSWSPSTGLSCTNCPEPTINTNTNQTYTLTVDDGQCPGSDFVTVEVAPAFPLDLGQDTSMCRNVPYTFNPTVGGGYSPYTYSYSPVNGSLDCYSCPNPTASADSTTSYVVAVTSALGCTLYDTLDVIISGEAPKVMGSVDTICPGDPVMLSPLVTYSCGPTTTACTGSPQMATPATGTSYTTTYGPMYSFTTSAYSQRKQYIYSAAELNAMGFYGGRIDAIALSVGGTPGDDITGVEIRMGCTSMDEWATSPYEFLTGLTLVKNAFTIQPVAGWNNFVFDQPYMWDGVSNVVIEFCADNLNMVLGSSVYYTCSSPVKYRCLYYNLYNSAGACSFPTGTRTSCRPDVRFSFCEANPPASYTWTPSGSLDNPNISNPTATPGTTTTYAVSVDDGSGCDGLGYVTVVIDSSIYVDATAADYLPCVGDNVQLNTLITGSPLPAALPSCGINGTACTQPNQTGTFGTGVSSTSTYSPFYGGYSDARIQYLYRASDLQAAGIGSGTISEIAFNVITHSSTGPFRNFTVSMGCTNETQLSTSGWEPTAVVWGSANYSAVLGWNNFVLDSPFDWDGSSNLVIECCFNLPNNSSVGYDYVQYTGTMGYNCTMKNYSSSNGTNGCTMAPAYLYTYLPNLQVTYCPPDPNVFTYSWSPSTGLSSPTDANPTANFTGDVTYVVTVTGGKCTVTDTVNLVACGPLPADELSLSGVRNGMQVDLSWRTVNEVQVSHFELERSGDGQYFERINEQPGSGTVSGDRHYAFTDEAPLQGSNFYRLRMYHEDGSFDYSNTVEIVFDEDAGLLAVYPNPVSPRQLLTVEYFTETGGSVKLALTDMLGRAVVRRDADAAMGLNKFQLPVTGLSKGAYFLRLEHGNQTETRKIFVSE